ncbi:HlyD family efflux transporter periplasmic adaptor subunit [Flavobacteriaceae bacterium MHTCC 0001]
MSDNNLDNLELRSEEVQEILTKVPHWMIRWGNVLFLSLIVLLLFMSWFIKYPDIILSEAVITTQIPPEKEYAQISGKIQVLLVEDNQYVKQNQPLAVLENTANYEDIFRLKSIIDTITVNNKSFNFPIDSFPILFLGDVESQFALFENSYTQYQLNKNLRPFSNEAIANKHTIAELYSRLQSLKAQRDIYKTELDFSKKDLDRHKALFDKGVISAQQYDYKQVQFAQIKRNYTNFEASISQLRESMSNAQMTSKTTDINKVREEMTLLKAVIQSFNLLKNAIKDWERLYVFKSNINGKVSFLNYWNTNQTVNQGDLVFTVIPSDNSSFVAKLKTPSQNSGKIKVGQAVNIKLENYPNTEFGVLNGTIKNISLVPNAEGFYFVDVELPIKLITSYNKEIDFKYEMRGTAEIITDDLRLIERFFYQLKKRL